MKLFKKIAAFVTAFALCSAMSMAFITGTAAEETDAFDWVPASYQEVQKYAPISIHDGYIVLNGAGYSDIAAEWIFTTEGTMECSEVYYAYFYEEAKSPDVVGGLGRNEFHVLKPEGNGLLSITWEYVTHGQPSMDKQYQMDFYIENGVIMEYPEPTDPVPPESTDGTLYEPGGAISLNHVPDKTIYSIGEELDLTGLAVSLDYYYGKDGHSLIYSQVNPEDYPEAFIIDTSEFDSSTPGTYTIRIYATEEAYGAYWLYLNDRLKFDVTVSSGVAGDANNDGEFSLLDLVLFQKWLLAVPDVHLDNWKAVDFNNDGILNIFDLLLMKKNLLAQSSEPEQNTEPVPMLLSIYENYAWGDMQAVQVYDQYGRSYEVKQSYDSNDFYQLTSDTWYTELCNIIRTNEPDAYREFSSEVMKEVNQYIQHIDQHQDCQMSDSKFMMYDGGIESLYAIYQDGSGNPCYQRLSQYGDSCAWQECEDVQHILKQLYPHLEEVMNQT